MSPQAVDVVAREARTKWHGQLDPSLAAREHERRARISPFGPPRTELTCDLHVRNQSGSQFFSQGSQKQFSIPEVGAGRFEGLETTVKRLIEADRVSEARLILSSLPAYVFGGPTLSRLSNALTPPSVRTGAQRTESYSPDNEWLKSHGKQYVGKWVAVYRGDLVAVSETLKDLLEILREKGTPGRPLVTHLHAGLS